MRKIAYFAAIAALAAIPGSSWCQGGQSQAQNQGSSAPPASAKSQPASQAQPTSDATAAAPAQEDSLAAAARKAKAQKSQSAAKPAKVFTNDDMPSSGISTVGVTNSGASSDSADASASGDEKGEKYWRDKFAKLNKKLEQDQAELDVMQRELGQLNLQNYSDPVTAMQQGYTRGDINKKTSDIDAKQKQIDADKQAIDDAQDDLRKSGGDPGWAR